MNSAGYPARYLLYLQEQEDGDNNHLEDNTMNRMNECVTTGTLLMVAGGIIGAGLTLLFAPQSGQRTRRDIVRISRRVKEETADTVEEFSETVHEMVDRVVDKATELVDKGQCMAQGAKKELLKAIGEGQARLEGEKMRLAELLN